MDDIVESPVGAVLVEALSTTLTRRMAERIVGDVRKNRAGASLPSDVPSLLALVRGELAQATFLRVGARAPAALVEVENRVLALEVVPMEAWSVPRVRLIYVGRGDENASRLARAIGSHDVTRVEWLHELLIALDTEERTLLVVNTDDAPIDAATLSRFVPDFPAHVVTFVAACSTAAREAYLASGGAFRATLRAESLDDPDLLPLLRDLVRGDAREPRRKRGGDTSTTTGPARAA